MAPVEWLQLQVLLDTESEGSLGDLYSWRALAPVDCSLGNKTTEKHHLTFCYTNDTAVTTLVLYHACC